MNNTAKSTPDYKNTLIEKQHQWLSSVYSIDGRLLIWWNWWVSIESPVMHSGDFWFFTSDLYLRCSHGFCLEDIGPAQLDIGCDDENSPLWKHKRKGEKYCQINDSLSRWKRTERYTDRRKFHGLSRTSIAQGQMGFENLARGIFPHWR